MIRLTWVEIKNRPENYKPLFLRMGLDRLVLIAMLDDDFMYSPAEVAATGYRKGSIAFGKAKITLEALANRNDFDTAYDNEDLKENEQKRWYGSSWKDCLTKDHRYFLGKLMDELKEAQEKRPGIYYLNSKYILKKARRTRKEKAPENRNNKKVISLDPYELKATAKMPNLHDVVKQTSNVQFILVEQEQTVEPNPKPSSRRKTNHALVHLQSTKPKPQTNFLPAKKEYKLAGRNWRDLRTIGLTLLFVSFVLYLFKSPSPMVPKPEKEVSNTHGPINLILPKCLIIE